MAIIRWDPFSELNSLHEQVNSLFNETFGSSGSHHAHMPTTDVYSDEKSLCIEAHLPNFKDEEIDVQQHNGELEIKAEHKEKDEEKDNDKDRKYLVRESVSQYYRRFTLPKNADTDNVQAHYENGVLKVTVPYKELPKPKKIQVSAGNGKKKK
jgi:HSP20 family protein